MSVHWGGRGPGHMCRLASFNSLAPPALGALSLDSTTYVQGTASSGNILGATAGSVISGTSLPTGFTLNSVARTWSYDGTGSASTGTMSLTETLGLTQNATPIDYAVIVVTAPVNTSAPIVTYDASQPGHYLSTTDGVWVADPPPTFTYAWQVAGVTVTGETGPTYLIRSGDNGSLINSVVTATSNGLSASKPSATVGPVTIPGGATIVGTVDAPVVTRTVANTVWPPKFNVTIPSYAQADSYSIEFQNSSSETFATTPIDVTSVISNAEATASPPAKAIAGLSAIVSPNVTYSRARIVWTTGGTTYASRWSNTCGHGDTSLPTISTPTTANCLDGEQLRVQLAANKTCTWTVYGGADQTWFDINSALYAEWFGDGVQSFAKPLAQGASNTYNCIFQATDLFGNTALLNLAATVVALGTPAFSFTPVTNAAISTLTVSPPAPVSGMTANHVYSASATTDYRISTDGGSTYGAWQSAGTVPGGVVNNPTIELRETSSASYSTPVSGSFTIGGTSSSFTVTTGVAPGAAGFIYLTQNTAQTTSVVLSAVAFPAGRRIVSTLGLNNASSVSGSVSGAFTKITITGNPTKHDLWIVPTSAAAGTETITATFPGGTTWSAAIAFAGVNLASATPTATSYKALASNADPKLFDNSLVTPSPGIGLAIVKGTAATGLSFNNGGTKIGDAASGSGGSTIRYGAGTIPPGTQTISFNTGTNNQADGIAAAWSQA